MDAGGGRTQGSITDYVTLADVRADNSNWQFEAEQRRVGQGYKVVIRSRMDYSPVIGDSIIWRGSAMTITGIQLIIKQQKWWEIKAVAVYGQT